MRNLWSLCISFLLMPFSPFGQELGWESDITTYAVVIGISDYQDEQRTDLKYAHRDAKTFADFLQSKAGGNTPPENIKLLRNEKATLAAIDDALNWLLAQTQKEQRAIFYFSGHGDVEKQTLWQLGYLLAYDTPFNNYRNNAVRLEDLNDLVTTLSVREEAEVIVITDACRSGKLAGSDNRGPSLTAEQMAKQAANEVRIMSCKPDQKSFEGAAWGGGRGVFSWHFINGLKGMADEDEDLKVTKEEVEFYLRDKFREEQRNQNITARQTPQFTGNEIFRLSSVNATDLATLKEEINAAELAAASLAENSAGDIASRGGSDDLESSFRNEGKGSAFDIFVRQATVGYYKDEDNFMDMFEEIGAERDAALQQEVIQKMEQFQFKPKSQIVMEFSALFKRLDAQNRLSRDFKNQLAIALHNKIQLAINEYLSGDARELARRYNITWGKEYEEYLTLMDLAMALLEAQHPLYRKLKIKYQYFDGVKTRLQSIISQDYPEELKKAIEIQTQVLELDDKAAYIHNELGLSYKWLWSYEGGNKDALYKKSKYHLEQAIELSPTWVLPHSNLGSLLALNGEFGKALEMIQKAINLKPDYYGSYVNLAYLYENEKDYLNAETLYRKAISLAPAHYLPFQRLAHLSLIIGNYETANSFFLTADSLTFGVHPLADEDGDGVPDNLDQELPDTPEGFIDIDALLERIRQNPDDVEAHYELGLGYKFLSQFDLAEKHLKKVIELQPEHPNVYGTLGMMFYENRQYAKAEIFLKKYVSQYPESAASLFDLGNLYHYWKRYDLEEQVYRQVIELEKEKRSSHLDKAYQQLWALLESLSRFRETEQVLQEYQRINQDNYYRAAEISRFYDRMMERFPNQVEWYQKQALYYTENDYEDEYIIPRYVSMLDIDPEIPDKADIYYKLGVLYARNNTLTKATEAFENALALTPEHLYVSFKLIQVYDRANQYLEALALLKKHRQESTIDLNNLLLLADYHIRQGKYELADSILQKAEAMSFETMTRIHQLYGDFYMITGKKVQSIAQFQKVLTQNPNDASAMYSIASQYAVDKKKSEAFNWLERALQNGFNFQRVLIYDPDWDLLRRDRKFNELLRKYNIN